MGGIMSFTLHCSVYGAEPWRCEDRGELEDVFREIAWQMRCDAGSDELETGSDEERDAYERATYARLSLRLLRDGDSVRVSDPIRPRGVVYTLTEENPVHGQIEDAEYERRMEP
jgi:hypothetical protein